MRSASTPRRAGFPLASLTAVLLVAVMCSVGFAAPPAATERRSEPALSPMSVEEAADRVLRRVEGLRDRARDFDQEAVLSALPPNRDNGATVRLDDRLDEARVASDREPGGDPSGALSWTFDGDDPVPLLRNGRPVPTHDGVVELTTDSTTVLISGDPVLLNTAAVGEIEIRMKVRRGKVAWFLWSEKRGRSTRTHRVLSERHDKKVAVDLVPDGEFHVYRLDATAVLRRKAVDVIRMVGLIPSDAAGDRVTIDSIRLVPKREKYVRTVAGRSVERRAEELRPVVHVLTDTALTWTVDVPTRDPVLDVGLGVLETGDPVSFGVTVASDALSRKILTRSVADAETWSDATLDLSPWAGQRVELTLEARSEGGNVAFWSNPVVRGARRRPFHVIVLLEDTLRADRLSIYGHSRDTSPRKDALARRGVVFEHAFSQATKTRPSVPSLMTSLLPSATGVWNHSHYLAEGYLTLAEVLRSQGFTTVSFLQNGNAGEAAGLHQGVSHLFDRELLGTGPFADQVLSWIDRHPNRNLFLYLHVIDPHGPYRPPEGDRLWLPPAGDEGTPVTRDLVRLDPEWIESPTVERRRALYDGEIRHNDRWLGSLFDELDERGILDDALVVMIADHGEHLGERGHWGHAPPGYTQVVHVPLVVLHPGELGPGRVDAPVQLMDVMPTILDAAGIDTGAMMLMGDSLLPVARGEAVPWWRSRMAISEEPMGFGSRDDPEVGGSVFRNGFHVLASAADRPARVFDYRRDPQETAPLDPDGESAALLKQALPLLERVIRTGNELRATMLPTEEHEVVELDPDTQDQLRALGYVE